ncbi:ABC transporter substrate-binding protein [Bradyrhizobium sp. OAE829]|uniref:ABC transporter substrate-binding protein n=1 Tax=Bradyrhizobium sp. OAE829 TaxID=2663807 RepID=UPI0017899422
MKLLLAMAMVVVAGSATAQESVRVFRLGVIAPSETSISLVRQYTLPELARRGFIEGKNLAVEERFGTPEKMAELARTLVRTRPDVVIAVSEIAIRPILEEDSTVPVVMSFIGSDPVKAGLATSISRPGGRVTGLMMLSDQLDAKRLEILQEAVPTTRRIAVLRGRPPRHDRNTEGLSDRAKKLGLELHYFYADDPTDYPPAFERMRAERVEALLIASAPDFARDAAILSTAATRIGIPTMCEWDYMAREGCLLSYGPVNAELRRRTAAFVAQILRGIPAGDLPIEGPVAFDFVINLRTADALNLKMPPTILARADEVVE